MSSPAVAHRFEQHIQLAHARRDPDEDDHAPNRHRSTSASASSAAALPVASVITAASRPFRTLSDDHQTQMAERALTLSIKCGRIAELIQSARTQHFMGLMFQPSLRVIAPALTLQPLPAALPSVSPARSPALGLLAPRLCAASSSSTANAMTSAAVMAAVSSAASSSSSTVVVRNSQINKLKTDLPRTVSSVIGPIIRLHSDALESVFSYLTLIELHRAFSVGRRWSGTLRRMGCRTGVEMRVGSSFGALARMSGALQSPLAQQVARVSARKSISRDRPGGFLPLTTPADLRLLCGLRRLVWLRCRPSPELLGGSGLPLAAFPPTLTRLDLMLGGCVLVAAVNSAFGAAAALPSLTELSVNLPAKRLAALDLSPLRHCESLRTLRLVLPHSARPGQMPDTFLAQLRLLAHLDQLHVTHMDGDALRRLCAQELPRMPGRPPPPLRPLHWRRLHVDACPNELQLDDQLAGLIAARMPHLTDLRVDWPVLRCQSMEWLARLPQLRRLQLHLGDASCPAATPTLATLTDALRPSAALTDLHLMVLAPENHWPEVKALFPQMRQLRVSADASGKGGYSFVSGQNS